jgi:hypothetical protein
MAERNLPWSIKGVGAEARAAAKEAARRAGLPLGAWLARAIREVAREEAAERSMPGQDDLAPGGTDR